MQTYRDTPEESEGMPRGVPYIIGNEAAERFSFYGMKSILTIFMVDYLHRMGNVYVDQGMSNAEATERYHTFTALVYFFPLAGALLSDTILGKYRTIFWLSLVYCGGHGALAMMGVPVITAGMWLVVGLWLISVGSGGIKPCVSAHVGDQFGSSNKHLLSKVYQWFYFSINFGSFISTLLTPWLLEHYGPHWAFGVPGVLMAAATLLFWMGRRVFIHIPPGGKSFLKETFSWTGITAVLKLSIIFSFVAVFWALFDQTGSSWVLQAKDLNRYWLGREWLASQIQAVNPILVLILIPVFQFVIYPSIHRVFRLTPIRKIGLGLFVMVAGFAIVAVLQERIDAGAQPSISWQFLAYGVLTASEVMVSITCLEFAYTQAPKTMKSLVMAVFLASVSLGNVFTAVVNNYIQTPAVSSLAAGIDISSLDSGDVIKSSKWNATYQTNGELQTIQEAGADGQAGTDDDITLVLDENGQLASVSTSSTAAFEDAAAKIESVFFGDSADDGEKKLPTVESGNKELQSATDSFGNPIRYRLQSRDSYQLISVGADGQDETQWDMILTGFVNRREPNTVDPAGGKIPYFNWLERKTIELKAGGDESMVAEIQQEILDSRGGGTKTRFSRDFTVGGRTLLERAAYFWFWTGCILVTAVLFIPVGLLYKEKTFIQGE
ncbi:MAG: MFS transporter [Fuerstiella sp.]|nr:MFS transporter [Fuerstiella sp.]